MFAPSAKMFGASWSQVDASVFSSFGTKVACGDVSVSSNLLNVSIHPINVTVVHALAFSYASVSCNFVGAKIANVGMNIGKHGLNAKAADMFVMA